MQVLSRYSLELLGFQLPVEAHRRPAPLVNSSDPESGQILHPDTCSVQQAEKPPNKAQLWPDAALNHNQDREIKIHTNCPIMSRHIREQIIFCAKIAPFPVLLLLVLL